jgi:starch phosphorylase
LEVIADDLHYGWNAEARKLFAILDSNLWRKCKHSPKLFLRQVSQSKIDQAVLDGNYMEDYARVLSSYKAYRKLKIHSKFSKKIDSEKDLIAYFCLEFGLHESVPIYSGGLGILAGDVCKAASDAAIPFVGVGLLYQQGYFNQEIDNYGNQIALYSSTEFENLPIKACRNTSGEEIRISIEVDNRVIHLKVWEATAGNINLYLLDSNISENELADREITHQLYGGDKEMRILQEIVLGIGGVRALRALNLYPTVWHINEGHAAFSTLERCRESVASDLTFSAALEFNASNVVFTTHTPVPAGHDVFKKELVEKYFSKFVDELGIDFDSFMKVGDDSNGDEFNMTALAFRTSRFHNAVSKIHQGVASEMAAHVWPQITPIENPIGCVTNGVHISTFIAKEWLNLFDMRFGDWRRDPSNCEFWDCLDEIAPHRVWSLRRELKTKLLKEVYSRLRKQCDRIGRTNATLTRITKLVKPYDSDVLILGFARRFATYKRANLLFYDLERLSRILNQTDRPIILLFAGKAHPEDVPGQALVKMIHDFTQRPEFQGRLIQVEDYDIALARKMVAGVDVWLNTPEYPLEACGTSGQKAGMNGALNLSVLDGWWGEGYNGKNGWALTPHGSEFDLEYRNQQEANDLYDIIENKVIPLYFERDGKGYSSKWVKLAIQSMKTIIPNFNAHRMLTDYINNFYIDALAKSSIIKSNNMQNAIELSKWKEKVRNAWSDVSIQCKSELPECVTQGEAFVIEVSAKLNGLLDTDVVVEAVLSDDEVTNTTSSNIETYRLSKGDAILDGEDIFKLKLDSKAAGRQFMKIRMYPYHEYLCHRFEMGCMVWVED